MLNRLATSSIFLALMFVAPHARAEEPELPNRPVDEHMGAVPTGGRTEGQAEDGDPTKHFNFTNVHYSGKDEYGGPFGDGMEVDPDGNKHEEEEPMSPPFVFLLANFAIVIFLLAKYLWPEARKLAESRHDQIKSALDEAAKLRDEAQHKLTALQARIKDVDGEIKKLVDGIKADAEADKARMLEAAAAQGAQMKKDAEQRIAAEIVLARHQLTKEITAAAAAATEKLLRAQTTPDDQRKLASAFITSIELEGINPPPQKVAR